ncbi:hypothetical protein BD780_001728 [Clostridium tetanomorphum]|uniref:Uncharacterized protein n=1 Tax=Clostridium tetanomorphum TaxID=1553 RepID=A0A923EBH1_CLOTT|nr:DUF5682 family protein [Clostridium tetanomorphum]KAJ51905.1 hypothetical protein CTM_10471 [Clostridium tetanomorphum DSM 665]MBC2398631.1 hypothetical protein [Clostridium tetanomorphum]MBP1864090.1 hypothetical protein [Clostridium tetanomorphum]NRS84503.1 hypothetical protein [Clostridium tetanomorphum]NRZ97717.1 hypothetical protein [Clostridium tetanomorphum]
MEKVNVFGVRHLSPGSSYHLIEFLEKIKPTAVLIEGLQDANEHIKSIVNAKNKAPLAILAYTDSVPVKTILYPIASYSPEYQALLWASKNNCYSAFIDLPSDVSLMLNIHSKKDESILDEQKDSLEYIHYEDSIYEKIAKLSNEPNYETYWERNFEHIKDLETYREAIFKFCMEIRNLTEESEAIHCKKEYARNLIREAFMRRQIKNTILSGHKPDKIVVVTGAYHASAINMDLDPMSDEEINALPRIKTNITLMPYSYYRLSKQGGYGAGNKAPFYFKLMWECLINNDLDKLPSLYFTTLVNHLRQAGTYRSPAEVIEGVRLAKSLAYLHGDKTPTLIDIQDACTVCLGQGRRAVVAEAMAKTEIGTEIGHIEEGVSQTPIQDDFYRKLKELNLEKYKSTVSQDLVLDLRENRRIKSERLAFLDLRRSEFLNKLKILNINFAVERHASQDKASWKEEWILKWTPESEIQLVEAVLLGNSVELATAFKLDQLLKECEDIKEASELILTACKCGMEKAVEDGRSIVQGLSIDAGDFVKIAKTLKNIYQVINFGSLRKIDTSSLTEIVEQLFFRLNLLLIDSCNCNDDRAKEMTTAICDINSIVADSSINLSNEFWTEKLIELSDRDDRNPKLSGYAAGILLEENKISDEKLSMEISRRLSPGVEVDLGAGWFEGLASRNHYTLVSKLIILEKLDEYISFLDDEEFRRALVFLRRAFSEFTPEHKRYISENLGELWNINNEESEEEFLNTLDEINEESFENLEDFDFGDI